MKLDEIIRRLQKSKIRILSLQDVKKLFEIEIDNSAYKTAENLVKRDLLRRLRNGLYASSFHPPEDFEAANYLCSPSYISLETALNFYGALSQFPYSITSVSPRKTRNFEADGREFEYVHLQSDFYWGYEKQKNFVIACPEKALLDEIYLIAKGFRKIELAELDYSRFNMRRLKKMANKIKSPIFRKYWQGLTL